MSRSRTVTDHDLLAVYGLYPRKRGKTLGIGKARRQIKTLEDLERFKQAVLNYRKLIEAEDTDIQYVLYFSTFLSQWEDFLDDEVMESAKVLNVSDIFRKKEA